MGSPLPEPQSTVVERTLEALRRATIDRDPFRFIEGTTAVDCGLASLAMVLAYHGRHVTIEQLRKTLPIDTDGVSARMLLDAARVYGLRARAVTLEFDQLEAVPPASILYWNFNHFVVLDWVRGGSARILDPAFGDRELPLDQVRKSFTGVVLLLEPTDQFEQVDTRPSLFRFVQKVLKDRGLIARILVVSAWIQLLSFTLPLLTGLVVDRLLPRKDEALFKVIIAGLAVVVVFRAFSGLVRDQLILYLRTRINTELLVGLFEHVVQLPLDFFRRRLSGSLVQRIDSVDYIREALGIQVVSVLLDGIFGLLAVTVLFFIDWRFGALTLFWSAVDTAAVVSRWKRFLKIARRQSEEASRAHAQLFEMLSGIQMIKAAGVELRILGRWAHALTDQLNLRLALGSMEAWLKMITTGIAVIAPASALMLGTRLVLDGQMSLGTMLGVNALAMSALVAAGSLADTVRSHLELPVHATRIQDLLEVEPEHFGRTVRPAGHLTGAVKLSKVVFRYGPLSPLVLDDVSLTVDAGQFVAIVGHSGSGKTTLGNMLIGLDLPAEGTVELDGVNIQEFDLGTVRRQTGVVGQKTFLLAATIRENISLLDNDIPVEEIIDAARVAAISDEIEAMPMKYDSLIAEDGSSLSGGQRQRLAIARAVVRKPVLMLLDEATSALDSETERRLQTNLASLQCTRIVIAHRLSTIRQADLIVVMAKGKIVEQGTHSQLLALNAHYARLIAAQLEPQS